MVPKLFGSGKSFTKLAAYLLHDPEKAKTAERVKWTHTLNLANDHPALAVDEMLWTARAAEDLKREAGLKTGGRKLENPVKHFSLNWHPSETPTREHMIETVESFLAHLKWSEHAALIVCHADKHPHVHVMLCAVHPETGRALDTSFEKRRAQEWAIEYEREHQLVFCEERLKPVSERTPSPTRATWEKLRGYEKEDDRAELERQTPPLDYFERGGVEQAQAREWKILKQDQREEREAFFAEGKEVYREARNAAYREVRTEFREAWSCFYDAKRRGMDAESLAEMKATIIAQQEGELDSRRQAACKELRTCRDWDYQQLLEQQLEDRGVLRARQAHGLRSLHLIDLAAAPETESRSYEAMNREPQPQEGERGAEWAVASFRSAANEVCHPGAEAPAATEKRDEQELFESPTHGPGRVRDGLDVAGGLGLGALGALASLGEKLFDGFLGGGESPKPPRPVALKTNLAKPEQESALRAVALQAKAVAEEAEAAKIQEWWSERRTRRHERD